MSEAMRVVIGWEGRYFEDFTVGDIYYHPMARTLTTTDNQWFTLVTQNTSKTHLDAEFAKQTEYKLPLMNSTFVLALVTGQSTIDLSFNVYANLGWDEVRLPAPVFEGDTIYSRSTVLSVRPSGSKPTLGIVKVGTEGYNQHGVVVIRYQRTFMVYRQGFGPHLEGNRPDESSLAEMHLANDR
ncbi:MaoC family dehydratase [Subtercola endophyticus]|uniref:MaoC family dehydratase n=1 Tax=Subtercola endophyticus TaxID=2895559 RepID=UPI001E63013E|nr:MaoC family dehydratase [Subtercola endophyticus]UFS58755.1 MaoC family dehydratase [Subtercola endophyticus]